MKNPSYLLGLFSRWAVLTGLLAILLFFAAGTTTIVAVRAYLGTFSVLLGLGMLAVDPGLAAERNHPGDGAEDAGVRFLSGLLFLTTLTTAALDVGRLHASDSVPSAVRLTALTFFALAMALEVWAMAVNPFFSPVIRLQQERGHHVISSGPYRLLRHPGYLAMVVSIPASALGIGSYLALIPAAAFVLVVVRRARIEEDFLRINLPGYRRYASHVSAGLVPHVPLQHAFVVVLILLALLGTPLLHKRDTAVPMPLQALLSGGATESIACSLPSVVSIELHACLEK